MRLSPIAPAAALALVLLAACATPPPATVPPPPGPPLPPPGEDTCGAAAYAHTLGDDYRDVPPAPEGRVFRVVCTTCAMTMDFNAERLNFFYDTTTGRVVRLTCG
jgi:hypothetical protein